jgi:hypothetical protein
MDSSLDDADDDGSLTGMADGNESIQGADDGFSSNSAQKQQQLRRPQSKGWPVSAMSSSSLSSSLPDYSSSTPSSPAFIVSTTQKSQTSVTPAQQQPRKRGRPKKAQPTTPQYPAGLLAGGSMYTPQQLEALQAQSIGFMNSFNVAALVSGSSSASVLNSAIAKKSTPYGRYLFYIPQPTDLVV